MKKLMETASYAVIALSMSMLGVHASDMNEEVDSFGRTPDHVNHGNSESDYDLSLDSQGREPHNPNYGNPQEDVL
ncbi:MAG: hypothetical protein GY915_03465 [bacterium]|nr:hypothetical protein [bacterium]